MEYFVMKLGSKIKNPVRPVLRGMSEPMISYDELSDFSLGYFDREGVEITDMLTSPVFMVNESIKKLFLLYDEKIKYKGIQLFSMDEKRIPLFYYAVHPQKLDCLHPRTRINPNGTVNEVILDMNKVPDKDIFIPDCLPVPIIIISLRVAESLLRRDIYGLGLEKVSLM